MSELSALADKILAQDRRALSRAITLVESNRQKDRALALSLLEIIMPYTGKAKRIGISGSPGVGKSTFIEAFGQHLISAGHRIAALTIDPSSKITGGSILGDKTRMPTLSNEAAAYVRPSPSGATLGGVARRSREVIALCEAAGYNFILIETVGVGQSETDVAIMTDCYLLLLQPASGDALQGIKRGVMEMADIAIINKADGPLLAAAHESATQTMQAISLMPHNMPGWNCPVLLCSSVKKEGMDEVANQISTFIDLAKQNGAFASKRKTQLQYWLEDEIHSQLRDRLQHDPHIKGRLAQLTGQIDDHQSPTKLATAFVNDLLPKT